MKKLLCLLILTALFLSTNSFCFAQNKKIDSLLILLKKDKPDTSKINHLNDLVFEYLNSEFYDSALHYGTAALKLARQLDFKKGIARANNNIGNFFLMQADYPRALDYYLIALKMDEELNNKKGISSRLGNIGNIYFHQADYQKALNYYFKALKIAEEIGNKNYISSWLGNIGNVYSDKGEYYKALDYGLQSIKISIELGNENATGKEFNNVGSVYEKLGNFPKALDSYFHSLKIREKSGDKKGIASTLTNLGSILRRMGKFKEAEKYLKRAIDIENTIDALDVIMQTEKVLSELYDTIGNPKLSLIHYKKEVEIKDTLFSQKNNEQIVRKEMNFEFDKKELAAKADQDKKDLITAAEEKKQLVIIKSAVLGLFLVILFAAYIFRSLRITSRRKGLIELQKNEVTKQKEEAEKQKDIAHSQRIIAEELREISDNQKHIVEEKQKEIVDSITYARRIQTALLTSGDYIKKHLPAEHFILFKPKAIVSGDFYWALSIAPFPNWDIGTNKIKLPKENERRHIFYLATADCTGHGVPGAFMSMLNISYLNENVIERGIRLPHDILNAQRKEIVQALNPEGSTDESKDGMDCTLCAYDFDKMLLHFAAANNPLWLIREKSSKLKVQSSEASENNSELNTQNFELIEYKADKMPVGKYSEKMESFTLNTIELQKGDIIYTSTDGFADQFGSNGKKLMKKKFKEELLKIHQQPMAEQKEYLNQFFENWKGSAEQVDDVCIIGVKI